MGNNNSSTSTTTTSLENVGVNVDLYATAEQSWPSLKALLSTGDLIFFKSTRPSMVSQLEDGEWTSANVVVKFSKENQVCIINATQNFVERKQVLTEGKVNSGLIGMIDIDDKMRYQSAPGELTYSEIAILRLKDFKLNPKIATDVGQFIKDSVGQQKSKSLNTKSVEIMSNSQETMMDTSEFFSGQICAEFFRACGILSPNMDLSKIISPEGLKTKLASKIEFYSPVILEVNASHKQRSWKHTMTAHGDYGKHPSHDIMINSQTSTEWSLEIPQNPSKAFQQAKNVRDAYLESKNPLQKSRALNLFEVSLMNECYYNNGDAPSKERIHEIEQNLSMLSE